MHNSNYIQGMLKQAKLMLTQCKWYEFTRKAEIHGYIIACIAILSEFTE